MAPRLQLDSRRLGYFLAVAEELNFHRAAEKLHMSQPPLSNQIKRMEEELGVKLFKRSGRGVELTAAGQLMVGEAERLMSQIEQTQSLVQRAGRGQVGQLRVGFTPSVANELLPPILHEFGGSFPEVEMFLHEMKSDLIIDQLESRWLDVGFLYLPFDDDRFFRRTVTREPLVVGLASSHRLASQASVSIEQLKDEPFIMPARHRRVPGVHSQIMELCARYGFAPKAVQKDVWLMHTIVGLAASKVGVCLVPGSMMKVRREGIVYKQIRGISPMVEMAVVWRREDEKLVLDSFLEVVHRVSSQRAEPEREG
jgi:DNA-binding transcriptional LysR family regulator